MGVWRGAEAWVEAPVLELLEMSLGSGLQGEEPEGLAEPILRGLLHGPGGGGGTYAAPHPQKTEAGPRHGASCLCFTTWL